MLHAPPWDWISDDDLDREVEHAHAMRHHAFLTGTAEALMNHTERVRQLEAEFLRRFPDRVADATAKSLLYQETSD